MKTIQNTWQDISWNRGNKKANKFVKVEEICSRIQWIKRKRDKKNNRKQRSKQKLKRRNRKRRRNRKKEKEKNAHNGRV